MNLLKVLFLSLVLFVGCQDKVLERSDILEEEVIVANLSYTPSIHSHDIAPGFSTNGGMTFSSITIDVPEQYNIVFNCPHGGFIVPERKDLFLRLIVGQTYTCLYTELYTSYYDNGALIERHLTEYDFLGVKEIPECMEVPYERPIVSAY